MSTTEKDNNLLAPRARPVRRANLAMSLWLGLAGVVATLLLFPYLLLMMPLKFAALPQPWWIVMLAQALQAGILCVLLGWIGLTLGARHGLDAPWLRAWVTGATPIRKGPGRWRHSLTLGIATGLLVSTVGLLFPHTPELTQARSLEWAWRGALASFYGGIVEETESRLFLVSLLVWLLAWFNRRRAAPWMFVTAIVLAALTFGAGHLPNAFAAGMSLAPLTVIRIVLLNALAGLVAGAVFWRWGFEHAIVMHFGADLMLHVALPLAGIL